MRLYPRKDSPSNPERLTAATSVTLIGIVETKALVQTLSDKIKLSAVEVRKAFGINQNLQTVSFKDQVLGSKLIDIFKLVSQSGATGGLDTQTHTNALSSLVKVTVDMPRSGFGH
jgi:hypothetical protein